MGLELKPSGLLMFNELPLCERYKHKKIIINNYRYDITIRLKFNYYEACAPWIAFFPVQLFCGAIS